MREVSEQRRGEENYRLTLGDYARIIWRKKFFLFIPVGIAILVAKIGVGFLVPVYESGAVVKIERQDAATREIARLVQADPGRRLRDSETMALLESDLTGATFLDELAKRLHMDEDPAIIRRARLSRERYPDIPVEELVMRRLRNMLKGRIEVRRVGPSLYKLAYADSDPHAAYVIAGEITQLYLDLQRKDRITGLQEASEFSDEQIALYKERLDTSVRALERFQQRMAKETTGNNPVTDGNVGQARTLLRQIDSQLGDTESTVSRIQKNLTGALGEIPSYRRAAADEDLHNIESDMVALNETQLLVELSGGTTPGQAATMPGGENPDPLSDARGRLQRRLALVVAREYNYISPDYRPLLVEYFYQQSELNTMQKKRNKLAAYIGSFNARVEQAPQMDTQLANLRNEVNTNRDLYESFLKAKTSTQITEAAENTNLASNMTIVENAAKPLNPVRPEKAKILVLALLFGMTIGGGGLLLTELTDTSFKNVEEVEKRLDLRVVGTVPKIASNPRWQPEGYVRRTILWVATSVVITAVALFSFYFYGKSSRAELQSVKVTQGTTANEEP